MFSSKKTVPKYYFSEGEQNEPQKLRSRKIKMFSSGASLNAHFENNGTSFILH
jgi:hypothetical protein